MAIVAGLFLIGGAIAQDDHEHDHAAPTVGPVSMADQLHEQLSRTVAVQLDGSEFEVVALWATPGYFTAAMPDAVADWAPADGIVLRIDETTHSDDLPAASTASDAVLVVGERTFEPVRREVDASDPHHRITTLRFALSPYQQGDVTLRLSGGVEIGWDAGRWFGVSADERILEVTADAEGFHPAEITVEAGQSLVFVFKNDSDDEHHFHIMDLAPTDLRWFQMPEHELASYTRDVLATAERMTGHMCTSDSGICRLGTNVHLHANPHQFDAVGFVPSEPGRYLVVCPLHANMRAEIVVR